MDRQHLKIYAACALALTGLVIGGRALWRAAPRAVEQAESQAEGPGPLPIAATLEAAFFEAETLRPEEVEDIASQIAARVRELMLSLPATQQPLPVRIDALATEVGEAFAIYLSGDYERYLSYVESRGANDPLLDTPEGRERLKTFFESTVPTITLRPVSLDEIRVRPRYLTGRTVAQEDLGAAAAVSAPENRYPIPQNAERSGLTVYETAVPVLYTWNGAESPMFIALWHAWNEEGRRWLPWRLVLYDPTRKASLVPPPLL